MPNERFRRLQRLIREVQEHPFQTDPKTVSLVRRIVLELKYLDATTLKQRIKNRERLRTKVPPKSGA